MSFSRPDPASPAQVADASFSTGRRGFDQDEVRDFLRMVSSELGRLHERERFLERELRTAQTAADVDASQLDDEALTRLLGEETARVLNAARESAVEIREKAEQSAARLLTEASDEASRRREEAEIEASRRRADAANDSEAELSMAKQQGREMVNEARAYRERVLSELARRRELAREQIEQLIHGRDRLMQSFERARLVAVDVVAEMQPLGEPDEYVNLQPTTGPVPVMVARDDTPRETPDEAVEADVAAADDHVAADADVAADAEMPTVDATPVDDATTHEQGNDLRLVDDAAVPEPDDDLRIVDDAATRDLDEPGTIDAQSDGEVDDEADDDVADARGDDADAEADEPDTGRDDVVVDLFARLRSGAPRVEIVGDDVADAEDVIDADDVVDADDAVDDADEADDADAVDDAAATLESAADLDENPDDEQGVESSVDAAEATPFEQRDADLTPLIVASAKKLKRVLADEQNEVLDALRRNDPVVDLDAILPWASEHSVRYRDALVDDLLIAANAGAQIASAGATTKLKKAHANECVDHAGGLLDERLVGPLRDRLERCIREGDGDNTSITKKVRAVYREWKTQHIDETLDDVMRAAYGRGVLAAIEVDAPTYWTPDPRHTACPDCDDNALQGAVAAGQPFPTGHTFAPAHPGCRCMLLPPAP